MEYTGFLFGGPRDITGLDGTLIQSFRYITFKKDN